MEKKIKINRSAPNFYNFKQTADHVEKIGGVQ